MILNTPYKIIIVEDEFPIAMDTELKLNAKGFKVIGIANNFSSLMELISEDTPDVILLDINLGEGGNGIDIAKKLKKILSVPFVFLSAYSNPEVVSSALSTEPFGYLVKPYKIEDLVIAIQLARSQWINKFQITDLITQPNEADLVFVQNGTKLVKIQTNEILFFQALDNYSILQSYKNKIIVSCYLSQLFEKFSTNKDFYQVHRSYVINLKNIVSIDGNTIYIDKYEIPISRAHKNELLNRIKVL